MTHRRFAAIGLAAVGALIAAGCTDKGQEVRVDDGDAAAIVAAAAESVTSGRMRQTVTTTMGWFDDEDEGAEYSMTLEGSFTGDRADLTITSEISSGPMKMGPLEQQVVVIGDTGYINVESFIEQLIVGFAAFDDDDDMGDPFDEELTEMVDSLRDAAGDYEWLSMSLPDGDSDGTSDGLSGLGGFNPFGSGGDSGVQMPRDALDELEDVREAGTVEFEGESLRRFTGRMAHPGLMVIEMMLDLDYYGLGSGDDDGSDPDEAARIERVLAYARQHLYTEVSVGIDAEGLPRVVESKTVDETEEKYRECFESMAAMAVESRLELFDLGEPVTIEEPDPSTVTPFDDLFDDHSAGTGIAGPEGDLGQSGSDLFDGIFDLDIATRGWLLDIDPESIPAMSLEEKVDIVERLDIAEAALPTFETPMGSMNRVDMLKSISIGMESYDVPPFDPAQFSDEELADLINGFLGARPDLAEEYAGAYDPRPIDGYHPDFDAYGDYDPFEACPA